MRSITSISTVVSHLYIHISLTTKLKGLRMSGRRSGIGSWLSVRSVAVGRS